MIRDLGEVEVQGDTQFDMEKAIKRFKMVTGPIIREYKQRTDFYKKPSIKKRMKWIEAAKRRRIEERKKKSRRD